MEIIMEFLFELIIEGSLEISSNKKVPKFIRYPALILVILLFTTLIIGLLILGIYIIKNNIYIGIFIILVDLLLFVAIIIKFFKINKKRSKHEINN